MILIFSYKYYQKINKRLKFSLLTKKPAIHFQLKFEEVVVDSENNNNCV